MSLIGSLEQFDLANILRRIEVFSKTGLLVVKRQDLWVEFYFRQGQLVCVGPVRSNATLIDRLIQANLLSPEILPQVRQAIAVSGSNETQVAFALIKDGHLSRELLRAWSAHETSQILQAIFTWQSGDIYFEEDCATPADRLLVALSVSQLLDVLPVAAAQTPPPSPALRPASASAPSTNEPLPPAATSAFPGSPEMGGMGQFNASQLLEGIAPFAPPAAGPQHGSPSLESATPSLSGNADAGGFLNASQLIDTTASSPSGSFNAARLVEETPPANFSSVAPSAPSGGLFGSLGETSAPAQCSFVPPRPVSHPLPPTRIDTSFMMPDLVLVPVDLSSLRERNPQVQLTPDQWRLFALIDGQSSLQMLCQTLAASSEVVCMLAGELMAIGLVMPLSQSTGSFNALAPQGMDASAAQSVSPVSYPSLPGRQPQPPQQSGAQSMPSSFPFEARSQWGNGNNGTAFMMGGGWMYPSMQGQGGPQVHQPSAAFAPVGGSR